MTVKKPQSAFFIFSGENRQAIKDELLKSVDKVSMGDVAKAIGARWKALSDEERKKYHDLAAAQKEAYDKAQSEAGCGGGKGGEGGEGGEGKVEEDGGAKDSVAKADTEEDKLRTHSMLPLSMVKKLATCDDEVTRISGDALKVITEAACMFLGSLASKSMEVALRNKRKNFKFEDMVTAARRDPRLVDMGLVKAFEEQEPFKGWMASSGNASGNGTAQRKRTADGGHAHAKKKAVEANGTIAAFFTAKKDHGDDEEDNNHQNAESS